MQHALLPALTLLLAWSLISRRGDSQPLRATSAATLAAFAICFAASWSRSPFREAARLEAVQWLNGFLVFACALALDPRGKMRARQAVCATALLYGALFLIPHFQHRSWTPPDVQWLVSTNVSAAFFAYALCLAAGLWQESRGLSAATAAVCAAGLLLARSAGAGVALLAASAVFLDFRSLRSGKLLTWGIAGLGFAALLTATRMESISDRLDWWRAAAQIAVQHLMWGAGPGAFSRWAPFHSQGSMQSPYAHSFPLQIAAELGIPAAAVILIFWTRRIARARDRSAAAAAFVLLFQGLADWTLQLPGMLMFLYLALGLCGEGPASVRTAQVSAATLRFTIFIAGLAAAWPWGLRPVRAFLETFPAQEAFDRMDWASARAHLSRAIAADPLPARPYRQLAALTAAAAQDRAQYQEAAELQETALRKEPLSAPDTQALISILKRMQPNTIE